MVTASNQETQSELAEEYIVDVDFHIDPPADRLLPYIEDDRIAHVVEKSGYPPTGIQWYSNYATNDEGSGLRTQGRAVTGEHLAEAMEVVGDDVVLVTPGINSLPGAQSPRMKTVLCRAFNDYVLDQVEGRDGLKMMAMLPQWDPDAMVEELERIGDRPEVVSGYGWVGAINKMLGAPDYDPVYEKLTDLDLPFTLHASTVFWPRSDPVGSGIRTWTELFGLAPGVYAIMTAGNMIMTGVFDAHPDLNVVFQETDFNWLTYAAYRMDEFYKDHPQDVQLTDRLALREQTYLERLPSEYLFDHFYFATQPICRPDRSDHFESQLELCEAESTLMFSSDWPHHTYDPPTWTLDLGEDLRNRVLHENAQEVYRL